MQSLLVVFLLVTTSCVVLSKPLDESIVDAEMDMSPVHRLWKRFINPSITSGNFDESSIVKMRTKRSEEDCEKLELCKLHARSNRNFFSAFELYFVNKENAQLWDHKRHSIADCERRFECYDD